MLPKVDDKNEPHDDQTTTYGRLPPPDSPLIRSPDVPSPEGQLEYLLKGYDWFEEKIRYR